jgi:prolyl-tRNA editing enzyme YbaK/EbsC (Cys-tRNA(Pro) deacylase)
MNIHSERTAAVIPTSHRLDLQAIDQELGRELGLAREHALQDLFFEL